eukprot:CAMPEP_0176119984 /NCGR_PEP_ID=MMETSP0120_2-20121206/60341_1 /TAXON_ID=160619 /ORGANISM="Kryptoperidinium foliaceum, Strain CCMP 1326" /LENGTH=155 /DNA_ID=CAMNT_0017454415 /DNA_START=55 /DNA_END=522 /DNA_ORIENTATION=-
MMKSCAALVLALTVAPSGALKVDAPPSAPHGLVAAGRQAHSAETEEAACAVARTQHRPKKTDTLEEYKGEAQGCLTWCSQFKSNCFEGCKNDCIGYLGTPPCAAFVMDTNGCKAACDALTAGHACLVDVKHDNTETCHSKLSAVSVPSSGCEYAN